MGRKCSKRDHWIWFVGTGPHWIKEEWCVGSAHLSTADRGRAASNLMLSVD